MCVCVCVCVCAHHCCRTAQGDRQNRAEIFAAAGERGKESMREEERQYSHLLPRQTEGTGREVWEKCLPVQLPAV